MKWNPLVFMKEFAFLFNRLPFYLIFYPTSRCNMRCPHCFNFSRQDNSNIKKELTLDEIAKISRNFGHVKVLTITGGEPFLRDDLAEIVAIFHKYNRVQYVSFHTNALLPDRVRSTISEVLSRLKDIQVFVCISIDGVGENHDRFRGVEGGFKKVLETVAKLKELKTKYKNLNLVSSTIFSHTTQDSFLDTIHYIQDNLEGVRPSLSFVRGDTKDSIEKTVDFKKYEDFHNNYKPKIDKKLNLFSPVAMKEAIETVASQIVVNNYLSRKQVVPCQAGRRLLVIYENGDVYPCEILGEKLGNLREANYDIKRIIFSKHTKRIINKIKKEKSCYCTWENVISVNLLFSLRYYPKIFYTWIQMLASRLRNVSSR